MTVIGGATTARAGTAPWVRDVLRTAWGLTDPVVRPFDSDGGVPLSHTAGLWRVTTAADPVRVFKVQLDAATARGRAFAPIKYEVLLRCAHAGIAVPLTVPTVDGRPVLRRDGAVCEVMPLLPGTARPTLTPPAADVVADTALALRAVLDTLPEHLLARLAPVAVPPLVAEPRWEAALADGLDRLLPMARARGDRWGRAVVAALEALATARPLLDRLADDPGHRGGVATRRAVVHGDLHRHHFLLTGDDTAVPRVTGVLDFDNLHVGDRLLDLAWIADTAARISGTPADRRRYLARLFARAERAGALPFAERRLLMPVLLAHATPVVVDIAKDICERGLFEQVWFDYLDLLSPARMLALDELITAL